MKISVILAHPDKKSFNHAIAKAVIKVLRDSGHVVFFHDLHKEKFDPVLPSREIRRGARIDRQIKKHCQEIMSANGIVIIHPNWWGQPPAILKGWLDRVIRPGIAYEFQEGDKGEGVPVGLLKAKSAIVFNTSNASVEREQKIFGDPLETIWKNCIFGLCGIRKFYRRNYGVIVTSSSDNRRVWLDDVQKLVDQTFPRRSRPKTIKRKDKYFVYIVECKDGTYYTGYTHDLEKRIALHNSGRGAKYLRGKRPVKLVYAKKYGYYKTALNEELRIKTFSRMEKEALVRRYKVGSEI